YRALELPRQRGHVRQGGIGCRELGVEIRNHLLVPRIRRLQRKLRIGVGVRVARSEAEQHPGQLMGRGDDVGQRTGRGRPGFDSRHDGRVEPRARPRHLVRQIDGPVLAQEILVPSHPPVGSRLPRLAAQAAAMNHDDRQVAARPGGNLVLHVHLIHGGVACTLQCAGPRRWRDRLHLAADKKAALAPDHQRPLGGTSRSADTHGCDHGTHQRQPQKAHESPPSGCRPENTRASPFPATSPGGAARLLLDWRGLVRWILPMQRRRFLLNGATFLATAATLEPRAEGADSKSLPGDPKTLGGPEPFDYARLKGRARTLADAPYKAPGGKVPPAIAKLDWDQWQSISFRKERALWASDDLPFRVRFFHLGFRAVKPVRMYEVQNGMSREIAYDPALFDYGKSGLRPGDAPADLGFAGFNLLFHTDWTRDRAAFQGASYFRATYGSRQYGMSQRGLAIDTGMSTPEEFPDFIAYYLERPAPRSNTVNVYGLLDSPSVTGAYRFVISVEDTLITDIDAAVYPRKQIERMGIAPGTSMFFYGKTDRRLAVDWRPEIHDSDVLQLWTGAGERIWRPLNNPHVLRVNTFADEQPRGFGLMQRERSFEQYEDDGVFYEKRPDVW